MSFPFVNNLSSLLMHHISKSIEEYDAQFHVAQNTVH